MKNLIKNLGLIVSLMLPALYCSAGSVQFEAITFFQSGPSSVVEGIERNTGNAITENVNNFNDKFREQCQALIIMTMEKPGRYYFYLTVEDDGFNTFVRCALALQASPS